MNTNKRLKKLIKESIKGKLNEVYREVPTADTVPITQNIELDDFKNVKDPSARPLFHGLNSLNKIAEGISGLLSKSDEDWRRIFFNDPQSEAHGLKPSTYLTFVVNDYSLSDLKNQAGEYLDFAKTELDAAEKIHKMLKKTHDEYNQDIPSIKRNVGLYLEKINILREKIINKLQEILNPKQEPGLLKSFINRLKR